MAFEHTKLVVYKKSLDLMVVTLKLISSAKPGWADLLDQLKRATTSIVLNIAEGAGEYRPGEKARIYRIALRSAAEAHAALDVLELVGALSTREVNTARPLLQEIGAMLVGLCKRVESRPIKRR